MFCDYDSSTPPSPNVVKLFEASIDNSFKDQLTRTRFLNKFYQCALGKGLPLKLKKLLACGEQDSGKTTWTYILKGRLDSRSQLT